MNQGFEHIQGNTMAVMQAAFDLNSVLLRRAATLQHALAELGIEGGTAQLRLFADLPEQRSLLERQQKLGHYCSARLAAIGRDATEVLRESCDGYLALLFSGMNAAIPAAPARAAARTAPRRKTPRKSPRKAA